MKCCARLLVRSLLLGVVWLARGAHALVWPALTAAGRWPPLIRLRARVGGLPPGLALPLFLIPELCSRGGWVAAAGLLLWGHPWQAMAVYAGTKLLAGGSALWIYTAAEPALLRILWFATLHRAVAQARRAALSWLRRRLALDASAVSRRSEVPIQVPATPSPPTGRGRTG